MNYLEDVFRAYNLAVVFIANEKTEIVALCQMSQSNFHFDLFLSTSSYVSVEVSLGHIQLNRI